MRPLAPAALARLMEAHQALARGEYLQAAAFLQSLADTAQGRGLPRAGLLQIEAGSALIRGGELDAGLDRVRRGLRAVASSGGADRLAIVGERVMAEVHSYSPPSVVQAIRSELESLMGGPAAPEDAVVAPAIRFPPRCTQCGGTVHPMEVEWADDRTAMCAYCGSVLPAEA